MRIGILEAGRLTSPLLERYGRYTQMFEVVLSGVEPSLEFSFYAALEGEFPKGVTACDGYVISGGANGVYDRLDWMQGLQIFAKDAAASGRKVFGICLGHQLLADAYGGKVVKSDKGWGAGVHRYNVHERQPWMDPERDMFSSPVMHQDQVVEIPSGSHVLAGNEFCPNAMVQFNENVASLQCHPEFEVPAVRALIEKRREIIGEEESDKALLSLHDRNDAPLVAKWIVQFLKEA